MIEIVKELTRALLRLLDNSSVSAFLGAAFAFLLVVAYDLWRDRRKLETITRAVSNNVEHATAKLETVRRLRNMIRDQNRVQPAQVLPFDVEAIRSKAVGIAHHFSGERSRALEAVCWRLEGCDQLLAEAKALSVALEPIEDQTERRRLVEKISTLYGDAIVNLKLAREMSERYACGDYDGILKRRYNPGSYREP